MITLLLVIISLFAAGCTSTVDESVDSIDEPTPGVDETEDNVVSNIGTNVLTSFNEEVESPDIDPTAYVHPLASVIGDVYIGTNVMVSPGASIRGDEGQPIHVGDDSNIQDGVVLHALETEEHGEVVENNLVEVDSKKYAIYVGERVSMAHQSHIHGPAEQNMRTAYIVGWILTCPTRRTGTAWLAQIDRLAACQRWINPFVCKLIAIWILHDH